VGAIDETGQVKAGTRTAGVAWCYQDPIPECPKIAGLICFDGSRVRVGAEVS
jgi:uncharacterized protein (DUF427 family)